MNFKKIADNTYLGTFHFVLILITAMFSYSSMASIWFEDDNEAGELLETAAIPRGLGEITDISGKLESNADIDMYKIYISNPNLFSAQAQLPFQGMKDLFDTIMVLFDENGFGVYGNDDATILARDDGYPGLPANHALGPKTPGIYYLAIFPDYSWISPLSGNAVSLNDLIFHQPTPPYTQITGPSGPGGAFPLTGWKLSNSRNPGFSETYHISLIGAEYLIPEFNDIEGLGLRLQVIIESEEKGEIEALWSKGGEAFTARGDKVVWGHFYANPADVSWGSINNPDLFVKIWFDISGRIDVNYFHVSVPNIQVHTSFFGDALTPDQSGTTNMSRRYIRHYFDPGNGGASFSEENYEDGFAPALDFESPDPIGYQIINDIHIGSQINTVEAGWLEGDWQYGGGSRTARGDEVVWGHFSADPSAVSWGNPDNPEVFIKIWFDVSGRIDVNYFHVSVPDIGVHSGYLNDVGFDQQGVTILQDRYTRHEFTKTLPPDNEIATAIWVGSKIYERAFGRGCGACHDISSNPNLFESVKTISKNDFFTVLRNGRNGMPKATDAIMAVGPVIKEGYSEHQALNAIYSYLKGRSDGTVPEGKLQKPQ